MYRRDKGHTLSSFIGNEKIIEEEEDDGDDDGDDDDDDDDGVNIDVADYVKPQLHPNDQGGYRCFLSK